MGSKAQAHALPSARDLSHARSNVATCVHVAVTSCGMYRAIVLGLHDTKKSCCRLSAWRLRCSGHWYELLIEFIINIWRVLCAHQRAYVRVFRTCRSKCDVRCFGYGRSLPLAAFGRRRRRPKCWNSNLCRIIIIPFSIKYFVINNQWYLLDLSLRSFKTVSLKSLHRKRWM